MDLNEALDLNLYKALLRTLGDYTDKFPATGVDKMLSKAITNGLKVVSKDKKAQLILKSIFSSGKPIPSVVHELLNTRFADLGIEERPIYKGPNGKRTVAFWSAGGKLYDKVIKLIDFDLEGKGYWADADGAEVELMDLEDTCQKQEDESMVG